MAISLADITGASVPAPSVTPAPSQPLLTPSSPAVAGDDNTPGKIPEAVLDIPEFSALLQGAPPAVYTQSGDKDPIIKPILDHAQDLISAGFGFYHAKDDKTDVLFNQQFISESEIKKADDEGRLTEVAVPLAELRQSFASVLGDSGQPSGGSTPPPVPATPTAPLPASSQNKLTTARLKNVALGSPTSGPTPGAGRIQSALLKPVI